MVSLNIKELKLERIRWLDAETWDNWQTHEDALRTTTQGKIEADAIGFMIAETDDRVILAGMINEQSVASIRSIPKCAIVWREELKGKRA